MTSPNRMRDEPPGVAERFSGLIPWVLLGTMFYLLFVPFEDWYVPSITECVEKAAGEIAKAVKSLLPDAATGATPPVRANPVVPGQGPTPLSGPAPDPGTGEAGGLFRSSR